MHDHGVEVDSCVVPLFIIDEAVARIRDGSMTAYVYDPKAAKLMKAWDSSSA